MHSAPPPSFSLILSRLCFSHSPTPSFSVCVSGWFYVTSHLKNVYSRFQKLWVALCCLSVPDMRQGESVFQDLFWSVNLVWITRRHLYSAPGMCLREGEQCCTVCWGRAGGSNGSHLKGRESERVGEGEEGREPPRCHGSREMHPGMGIVCFHGEGGCLSAIGQLQTDYVYVLFSLDLIGPIFKELRNSLRSVIS